MPISLKHKFTSAKADGADAARVRPSNWNDEHDLTMATARLLGRTTAGAGAAEEITVGAGLSLSGQQLSNASPALQNNAAASNPGVGNDSSQGYARGSMWFNTATGTAWRCHDASVGAALWYPQPALQHPGALSGGKWLPTTGVGAAAAVVAVDSYYFLSFMVPFPLTVSAIEIYCTATAASSVMKAGIWAHNQATGRPTGTPLVSNNTGVATSAIGLASLGISSFTLQPGVPYAVGAKFGTLVPTVLMCFVAAFEQTRLLNRGLGTSATTHAIGARTNTSTFPYANNIATDDVTGASWLDAVNTQLPAFQFGVA